MGGEIQLLLPGLFELPPAELPPDAAPHLGRLLRYASKRPNAGYTLDALLVEALALELPGGAGRALPVARAFAEDAGESRDLLFEAVHLRPDMQHALVVPIGLSPS